MRGHIRRRGSKYVIVVDIGVDAKGRRQQRWHSGFRTKKEAELALPKILSDLQNKTYVEPSKLTVAKFMRDWLDSTKATIRHSTWTSYRMQLETHVLPRIGARPLQSLTTSQINTLYAQLLENGRRHGEGGLHPRTVRYTHMIIRKALAAAVQWQHVARNVADGAAPPRARASAGMQTWSSDELRAFLDYVSDDRRYAAWLIAAATGMRRGEVLGLRWRDVDLDAGRAAITQTLLSVGNKLSFSTPKTAKGRRLVALDHITIAALRAQRSRQLEERLAHGPGYQDNELVFCKPDGSPIHPDSFSQGFERAAKRAGVSRIRLHDLRHTHATLALQAGIHPKVVSERLGHATVSITLDTYSHAIPAMQEDAAARVAAVVFGGSR